MRPIKKIAFSMVLLSVMAASGYARDHRCISEHDQILKQQFQNAANYYSDHAEYYRDQESAQDARVLCENAITDINNCQDGTRNIQRCKETRYYTYCYGSQQNHNNPNMRWLTDKCISVSNQNNSSSYTPSDERSNWVDELINELRNKLSQ